MAFKALSGILFALIGIFGINFLVGFHELGHFFFASYLKYALPPFPLDLALNSLAKKLATPNLCSRLYLWVAM